MIYPDSLRVRWNSGLPMTLGELMRILDSVYLMQITRNFEKISAQLAGLSNSNEKVNPNFARGLDGFLVPLRESLEPVELPVSVTQLDRIRTAIGSLGPPTYVELSYAINHLMTVVEDELRSCKILQIPRDRASYYGRTDLFGPDVTKRFPEVIGDIDEAANCYALGRFTATVFHLMRAMEGALHKMTVAFKITLDPKKQDWQDMVNAVRTHLNQMPARDDAEKAEREKVADVAAHLEAVKIAWRNPTMHPRAGAYTEPQAFDIINNCKALFVSLLRVV